MPDPGPTSAADPADREEPSPARIGENGRFPDAFHSPTGGADERPLVEQVRRAEERRRAAEEALRALEERLDAIVAERTAEVRKKEAELLEAQAVSRVGSWTWDARGDRLTGSGEFYRLFGVSPERIGSLSGFLDLLHADDRPAVERAVASALVGDGSYQATYRVASPDGGWRYLAARGFVAFDEAKCPVRMVGTCLDITDRVQADEALRKSEERLRRIAATVPGILYEYVLDDDADGPEGYGRFLFVTPGCRELLEVEPQALLSDVGAFWRMVHPDDRDRLRRENVEAVRGGVSFVSECRVVTPSGLLKWLSFKSRPNPSKSGERVIWSGVILDVTDRKRAEAEREAAGKLVAAQRELFEVMLRSAPVGLVLFRGPEFVVEMLNPAYQAVAPGKKMLGRKLAEIWPEAIDELRPIYERVRETGESFEVFDAPFVLQRTADGPPLTCWFSWTLVRTHIPGTDEWGVLASTVETTAQVKARQAIELLEERLVLAQEASGSGTWDWDFESGKLAWSPEFFRLFGLDPETQPATFETWRAVLHPLDRERAEENIAIAVRQRTRLVQTYRIVLPGGGVRWIEARGNTSYDDSGAPKRMAGLCIDVTERVTAEEELKAHREHLEELVAARTAELENANRELETFSYSVSHDLRAPLRALDGFVDALLEGYPDRLDEKGRHYLDRIQVAARRMGRLINEILELSRLSRRELKVARVDLSALAREVVAELLASEPGRRVDASVAEGMETEADPVLLRSALENLVGNAIKFSSRRSDPRIEVGQLRQDGSTVFYVRDNGVGFDMQWAEKLFTPFQRLHGPAEFPGTGIGLATVHRIVARHGGSVWPEATLDGGATFYFTIGRSHE